MHSVESAPPLPGTEPPTLASPATPIEQRVFGYYIWLASLLFAFLLAFVLCPALKGVWWHVRHDSHIVWRETSFKLPLAWSASQPNVAQHDQVMLTRWSWFAFTSPALNTLFLAPPNPKMYLSPEDLMQAMAINGQPVSASSRMIAGRSFQCLSQPVPQHGFSLGGARIHAHCELDRPSWELEYYGSPAFLDEGLGIVARGELAAQQ
jgi:hypothetical protein